jgi:hypothetical protein
MAAAVVVGGCARCGQVRRVWARGLCTTCYPIAYRAGELARYPCRVPRRAGRGEPRGRGKPPRARALGAARLARARARVLGYEALRRQEWLATRAEVA